MRGKGEGTSQATSLSPESINGLLSTLTSLATGCAPRMQCTSLTAILCNFIAGRGAGGLFPVGARCGAAGEGQAGAEALHIRGTLLNARP